MDGMDGMDGMDEVVMFLLAVGYGFASISTSLRDSSSRKAIKS